MLLRIGIWLAAFLISLFFQWQFGVEQGIIFMCLYLGTTLITSIAVFVTSGAKAAHEGSERIGAALMGLGVVLTVLQALLMVLAAWIVSMFVAADMFLSYELMSLGGCFVGDITGLPSKDNKSNKNGKSPKESRSSTQKTLV